MRYSLNIDKAINQLVPHFFGGRKLVLYLQAICSPLQEINGKFCNWAKEKKIETCMTSQVIMLEWYLNRQFSKYFENDKERITIFNEDNINGVPIYRENNEIDTTHVVYKSTEDLPEGANVEPLYYEREKRGFDIVSFLVKSPKINTGLITEEEYKTMLSTLIDRYKIAGKTYSIIINTK